jgi:exodeoxyribonuclease V gamma subunit
VPLKTYRSLLEQHVSLCSLGSLRVDATDITLEDTLPEVRADAAGNRLRLRLQASRLGEGKDLKWYHLARDWPLHLAAQLHGPTATRFLGPETDLMVPPLAADAARGLLSELLETYRECMTVLPPLACKTGFAVLQASEGIVANPTQVYEGGYDRDGEREDHPAYRRFWPSFENLNADKSFGQLVDRLYRPLFRHCRDQGRL